MLTLLVVTVFIFVITTAATGHAFAQPATSGVFIILFIQSHHYSLLQAGKLRKLFCYVHNLVKIFTYGPKYYMIYPHLFYSFYISSYFINTPGKRKPFFSILR